MNSNGITIEGGSPRPVITSSSNGVALYLTGTNSTIRQLEIQDTGGGDAAAVQGAGATIQQVIAMANTSITNAACSIEGSGAAILDSGLHSTPPAAGA